MSMPDQQTHLKWGQNCVAYRLACHRLLCNPRGWLIAISSEVKRQLVDVDADMERVPSDFSLSDIPAVDMAVVMPRCVLDFVGSHTHVLSTYGFRLFFNARSRDLYGFQLCIYLLQQLCVNHTLVGKVVCMAGIRLPDYYAELPRAEPCAFFRDVMNIYETVFR